MRTLVRAIPRVVIWLSCWQSLQKGFSAAWFDDCLVRGMANPTLAPDDDDDFLLVDNFGPSPNKNLAVTKAPTSEAETLHLRFDPHKIGFGLFAPWPTFEHIVKVKEVGIVKISIQGKDQGEQK